MCEPLPPVNHAGAEWLPTNAADGAKRTAAHQGARHPALLVGSVEATATHFWWITFPVIFEAKVLSGNDCWCPLYN